KSSHPIVSSTETPTRWAWSIMQIILGGLKRAGQNFCAKIGLPYKTIEAQGFHFPVTEVSCRYFKSAHYDDLITIATQLTSVGRASLTFDYIISREGDTSSLASGSTKHACVDVDGRITRIPGDLTQRLAKVLITPTQLT
ncbi:MAG TPA: thioesterase family protein, partial [Candidatus Binatia bacterium]